MQGAPFTYGRGALIMGITKTDDSLEYYQEILPNINAPTLIGGNNNMKKVRDLGTLAITANVLNVQNQWAGVIELTNGSGTNSIHSITQSNCNVLTIKNSSGYDLTITTGGTIIFPAHILSSQTVPNGGYIKFTKTDTGAFMVG